MCHITSAMRAESLVKYLSPIPMRTESLVKHLRPILSSVLFAMGLFCTPHPVH